MTRQSVRFPLSLFAALLLLVGRSAGATELANFSTKLGAILSGTQTRANILVIGDSISGDTMLPLYAALNQKYGNGGISGGPGQLGLLTRYSSGVTINPGADYSRAISGHWATVGVGQSFTFQKAYSAPVDQSPSPVMKELKFYYLTEPGGGTFSVETAPMSGFNPGTFTPLPGYSAVSTDGAVGYGVLTIPVSPGADLSWRMTTTSGNVKLLNGGWSGDSGINFNYMLSAGGTKLVDYASAPDDIWSVFLGDVAPDLVIISVKDDATPDFRSAVVAIQNRINAANPLADTVFVGAYNSQADDPGYLPAPSADHTMAAQNAILQDVVNDPSVAGSNYYWNAGDVIGTWTEGNANGWYSDTIHLNDAGRAVLADAFARDFQLLPAPVPEPTAVGLFVVGGLGLAILRRRRA